MTIREIMNKITFNIHNNDLIELEICEHQKYNFDLDEMIINILLYDKNFEVLLEHIPRINTLLKRKKILDFKSFITVDFFEHIFSCYLDAKNERFYLVTELIKSFLKNASLYGNDNDNYYLDYINTLIDKIPLYLDEKDAIYLDAITYTYLNRACKQDILSKIELDIINKLLEDIDDNVLRFLISALNNDLNPSYLLPSITRNMNLTKFNYKKLLLIISVLFNNMEIDKYKEVAINISYDFLESGTLIPICFTYLINNINEIKNISCILKYKDSKDTNILLNMFRLLVKLIDVRPNYSDVVCSQLTLRNYINISRKITLEVVCLQIQTVCINNRITREDIHVLMTIFDYESERELTIKVLNIFNLFHDSVIKFLSKTDIEYINMSCENYGLELFL